MVSHFLVFYCPCGRIGRWQLSYPTSSLSVAGEEIELGFQFCERCVKRNCCLPPLAKFLCVANGGGGNMSSHTQKGIESLVSVRKQNAGEQVFMGRNLGFEYI